MKDAPEARPIEFPAKPLLPVEIPELPFWIKNMAPPDVSVSVFERGALFVHQIGQIGSLGLWLVSNAIKLSLVLPHGEKMNWLEILKNRRVIATIIAALVGLLGIFKIALPDWATNVEGLTDQVLALIGIISTVVTGFLAFLSYVKPKTP